MGETFLFVVGLGILLSSARANAVPITELHTQGLAENIAQSIHKGNPKLLTHYLHYLNQTTSQDVKLAGFKSLLQSMYHNKQEHSEEMMRLSYYIKLAVSNGKMNKTLASEYETLKASLPKSIRAIVFEDHVIIRNRHFEEYLFESTFKHNNHRLLLTWRPGNPISNGVFYFTLHLEGDDLYYHLKNVDYDGAPMCRGEAYMNDDRIRVVSCPGDNEGDHLRWYVTPREDGYFNIQNSDRKYLYAGDYTYDNDRRYAFTWSPGGDGSSVNWQWEITPA